MRARNLYRLAVASAGGLAQAYAHQRRLDRPLALAQIRRCLSDYRIEPQDMVRVLSEAASMVVDGGEVQWWWRDAVELLVEAGADRDLVGSLSAGFPKRRAQLLVLRRQATKPTQ